MSNLDQPSELHLTRQQTIERIITINRSATAAFLERFTDPRLAKYLEHLLSAQTPRGRFARWDRPGDAPAIVMAKPRD